MRSPHARPLPCLSVTSIAVSGRTVQQNTEATHGMHAWHTRRRREGAHGEVGRRLKESDSYDHHTYVSSYALDAQADVTLGRLVLVVVPEQQAEITAVRGSVRHSLPYDTGAVYVVMMRDRQRDRQRDDVSMIATDVSIIVL